jgi:tripartite-type tricarboxylate transporter receptor subunit TctC
MKPITMSITVHRWLCASLIAVCGAFHGTAATAQSYPSRPIRMVLPFPAGGSADITARLATGKVAEAFGQPVIVDNRVGAAGVIGTEVVQRAAPDGYTLLFTTPSHVSALFLSKSLPYHPVKDFTAVSAVAEGISGLVVHPSIPARTVQELVDYARANPGRLTYSSSGVGSSFHLIGETFRQAAGIDIVHVPYKGAAQALNDMVGGNISMTFSTLAPQLPLVRAGKARLIAVLENNRYPALPDVPTVREALPSFRRLDSWMGVLGPAGLPPAVANRMSEGLSRAINAPELRARLDELAFLPVGSTPEQFAAMLNASLVTFADAIKAAGVKPE